MPPGAHDSVESIRCLADPRLALLPSTARNRAHHSSETTGKAGPLSGWVRTVDQFLLIAVSTAGRLLDVEDAPGRGRTPRPNHYPSHARWARRPYPPCGLWWTVPSPRSSWSRGRDHVIKSRVAAHHTTPSFQATWTVAPWVRTRRVGPGRPACSRGGHVAGGVSLGFDLAGRRCPVVLDPTRLCYHGPASAVGSSGAYPPGSIDRNRRCRYASSDSTSPTLPRNDGWNLPQTLANHCPEGLTSAKDYRGVMIWSFLAHFTHMCTAMNHLPNCHTLPPHAPLCPFH